MKENSQKSEKHLISCKVAGMLANNHGMPSKQVRMQAICEHLEEYYDMVLEFLKLDKHKAKLVIHSDIKELSNFIEQILTEYGFKFEFIQTSGFLSNKVIIE